MKLTYDEVKTKEEVLKAMTSLTRLEFEELAIYFQEALHFKLPPKDPRKGGRPSRLQTIEDQLFSSYFILKHIRFKKYSVICLVWIKVKRTIGFIS